MIKKLSILLLAILSTISCTKAQLQTIFAEQEKQIESYVTKIAEENEGAKISRNKGSNRVTLIEGTSSDGLKVGGKIKFYYAAFVFSNGVSTSKLFDTNNKEIAKEAGWEISDTTYLIKEARLDDDNFVLGLKNGLVGVKTGEACVIVFSGEYGFGKKPLGTIPANSALAYQIWVEEISN